MGSRADRFAHNVDFLGELGFRAVALDLPGHGFSSKGSHLPHTVGSLRDVVIDLLNHLSAEGADEPASLIGTSLGGHICAAVAIEQPEKTRDLVLIGSMGLEALGAEGRGQFGNRVQDTSLTAITNKLTKLITSRQLVTEAWITEEFRINNSPGAAEYFAALGKYVAESIDDDVVADALGIISDKVKVHLAWGAHDRSIDLSVAERIRDEYGFTLTTFENSGHAPYLEEYAAFNSYLKAILS
jgi:2-hydroxy-6-oxonona-2,4-dienedioate hydrolase